MLLNSLTAEHEGIASATATKTGRDIVFSGHYPLLTVEQLE